MILYYTQLKSDDRAATGHRMFREKILKGQETLFLVQESWFFEEKL